MCVVLRAVWHLVFEEKPLLACLRSSTQTSTCTHKPPTSKRVVHPYATNLQHDVVKSLVDRTHVGPLPEGHVVVLLPRLLEPKDDRSVGKCVRVCMRRVG